MPIIAIITITIVSTLVFAFIFHKVYDVFHPIALESIDIDGSNKQKFNTSDLKMLGYINHDELVSCGKCRCLLLKDLAIKGKSEILTSKKYIPGSFGKYEKKEYIYTPYFCKTHAPKTIKKEK